MDVLKAELQFETGFINELIKAIPELNGGFLSLVGARARTLLKQKYLSGQELNYKSFDTDKMGRNLITSDVNKRRDETKIYSYPVNLFETGRTLRDGSREQGKYIITKKLKQDIMMNMDSYVVEFERKIQGDLDKI